MQSRQKNYQMARFISLLIGIQGFILFGQVIIVTFGGRALRVHRLSITQHLECLGIGALTLVVGFFVKFIPIDTREEVAYGDDQEKPKEENVTASFGCKSRSGRQFGFKSQNKSKRKN